MERRLTTAADQRAGRQNLNVLLMEIGQRVWRDCAVRRERVVVGVQQSAEVIVYQRENS